MRKRAAIAAAIVSVVTCVLIGANVEGMEGVAVLAILLGFAGIAAALPPQVHLPTQRLNARQLGAVALGLVSRRSNGR